MYQLYDLLPPLINNVKKRMGYFLLKLQIRHLLSIFSEKNSTFCISAVLFIAEDKKNPYWTHFPPPSLQPVPGSKFYAIFQHIHETILIEYYITMASFPEWIPLIINSLDMLSSKDLMVISFQLGFSFPHGNIASLENLSRHHITPPPSWSQRMIVYFNFTFGHLGMYYSVVNGRWDIVMWAALRIRLHYG